MVMHDHSLVNDFRVVVTVVACIRMSPAEITAPIIACAWVSPAEISSTTSTASSYDLGAVNRGFYWAYTRFYSNKALIWRHYRLDAAANAAANIAACVAWRSNNTACVARRSNATITTTYAYAAIALGITD